MLVTTKVRPGLRPIGVRAQELLDLPDLLEPQPSEDREFWRFVDPPTRAPTATPSRAPPRPGAWL